MRRENEPEKIGDRARPAQHGRGHIGVRNQVGKRSSRLGLDAEAIPRRSHRLEQPIDDGPAAGTDNGSPAAGIGSGNVREQRGNPKLEAGADLVVGG